MTRVRPEACGASGTNSAMFLYSGSLCGGRTEPGGVVIPSPGRQTAGVFRGDCKTRRAAQGDSRFLTCLKEQHQAPAATVSPDRPDSLTSLFGPLMSGCNSLMTRSDKRQLSTMYTTANSSMWSWRRRLALCRRARSSAFVCQPATNGQRASAPTGVTLRVLGRVEQSRYPSQVTTLARCSIRSRSTLRRGARCGCLDRCRRIHASLAAATIDPHSVDRIRRRSTAGLGTGSILLRWVRHWYGLYRAGNPVMILTLSH